MALNFKIEYLRILSNMSKIEIREIMSNPFPFHNTPA